MEKKKIQLDKFEGHIVLLTKGYYPIKKVEYLTAVRRLWATRCGLDNEHVENKSCDIYLANALYKLAKKVTTNSVMDIGFIHEALTRVSFEYEGLNSIEKLIRYYLSVIGCCQVMEKNENGKWEFIMNLPKPNKRTIGKIIRGNGKYGDYYKVFSDK